MDTWKKVKKSGTYYRNVKKNRDEILRKAEIYTEELRKKRKVEEDMARNADLLPKPIIPSDTSSKITVKIIRPIINESNNGPIMEDDLPKIANDDNDIAIEEMKMLQKVQQMEKEMDFKDNLRKWSIEYKVTQSALRALLKLINDGFGEMFPSDPRTFLNTSQEVVISKIGTDGQYWHNGFEKNIRNIFQNVTESKTISINVNMDGLPLFKSSKNEVWPILFNITEMPNIKPKVIGIYFGSSKCADLDSYLGPFVSEMKEVMTNGIIINSHKITVLLRAIICDSPARSFVKGKIQYNNINALYLYVLFLF